MKSFKQYLLESILDDEDVLASNDIPLIEDFLKKNYKLYGSYNIREEDGIYYVYASDVMVKNLNLKRLTLPSFKFKQAIEFQCDNCKSLESLEGSPQECNVFSCSECTKLTSLEGAPRKVDGFYCDKCKSLTNLKGAPQKCSVFSCSECTKLTSLEGAPRKCEEFNCSDCKSLTSLKYAPKNSSIVWFGCDNIK